MKRPTWLKLPKFTSSQVVILIVSVIALLAILTVGVVRVVYQDNLQPASPSQHSRTIAVPLGSTPHSIAVMLQQQGIIRSSWAFEWYIRSKEVRDQLKAGSYELRPSQSVSEIVDILTEGRIATNLVTILPAQRLDQVEKSLVNAGFSADAVKAALDASLYADHPALTDKPPAANLEGYLYPNSWKKDSNTKPEDIIRQSLDEMDKHLTPELRDAITKNGLSVHEGVILASIIEQEVSTPSDRATVAQVFYSRLNQGMPLQSDVTAYYGAHLMGVTPSTKVNSPYNTYLHTGLPPGPISNVSQTSLDAVAHPANTDYLYFVAGDNGTTYFAHTQAEHEAQVQQYCHKLCSSP